MTDLAITKMDVRNLPANKQGNRMVASFDLNLAALTLQGCALIENADGTIVARGPLGRNMATGPKGFQVAARFTDPDMVEAVTAKAVTAYAALTWRTLSMEEPEQ